MVNPCRFLLLVASMPRCLPQTVAGSVTNRATSSATSSVVLLRPTCLERALVIQAWIGGYAEPPDVVIGIRRRAGVVEAHAWVDGADPWFDPSYHEIARFDA